ncbi:MAG TPA: heavy metal translocating P-type ATPase metal-binding domain-containing protein, partial [Polyangiaceae bacterium]
MLSSAPGMAACCLHCGLALSSGGVGVFCCPGCAAVYALLHDEHLDRYYELRRGKGVPVADLPAARRDTKWLVALEQGLRAESSASRITLDVQGLHCVGCVWLIEELFRRTTTEGRIVVNTAVGRIDMVVGPRFDLRGFVGHVERFGYLLGQPLKNGPRPSSDLLWRLGVCAAIAMNSMIFAIPLYAGLERGRIFSLFTTLDFALGAAAVVIGGSVFFRSAAQAIRRGILHLDLPIALGIALAFAGSVHSYLAYRSRGAYFDTLDVFIALMLLGRFLQERAVDRNRAWLLASDGTDGLLARRMREGRIDVVRCADIAKGDTLLLAPGDLVPVDAILELQGASFSLDWIVGESRPRSYAPGERVAAGAFATGNEAVFARAATPFEESPLRELLRAPEPGSPDGARMTVFFQKLSKAYVLVVLALSAAGFVAWRLATGDFARAFDVSTAVLIVTCPCAFGIAAPLAYEIVQARLRRAGLFVRRASFLDRARAVRRVVFDKTGTLTTGELVLGNPEVLDSLLPEQAAILYDLAARSGHPKSAAVRDAFASRDVSVARRLRAVERAGLGLEATIDGRVWRLGEPSWVARSGGTATAADLAFGVDGRVLAPLATVERPRPDAAKEVSALEADGMEVWLLSGDTQPRVEAAAAACGIPARHAVGEQTPRSKAAFLDAHDNADTLFVGDGVNDALALDHAHVSGTPAVDRPYLPARADFFFVTPGLAPLRLALRTARALAQVVRAVLAIALVYNAVAIALALAGR